MLRISYIGFCVNSPNLRFSPFPHLTRFTVGAIRQDISSRSIFKGRIALEQEGLPVQRATLLLRNKVFSDLDGSPLLRKVN